MCDHDFQYFLHLSKRIQLIAMPFKSFCRSHLRLDTVNGEIVPLFYYSENLSVKVMKL